MVDKVSDFVGVIEQVGAIVANVCIDVIHNVVKCEV